MEEILSLLVQNNNEGIEKVELIADLVEDQTSDSSSDESEIEEISDSDNFVNCIDGYSEEVFKSHMRLKRSTVEFLICRFSQSSYAVEYSAGRKQISNKAIVFMYIWYISNTVTYRQLSSLFGVKKSSAWNAVRRVSSWLISVSHEYIKWPQGEEAARISQKFWRKQQIPGVIGCIDCTHININAPVANKECYFNRKQSYSLILQAVVDADKKFIDIYCGEPGSLHDSRVLRRSGLYRRAYENNSEMFPEATFILGDSAYFGTQWLVQPFKDTGSLTNAQKRFNERHSRTRIVVENASGSLKTRFRRLLKFTEHRDLNAITNLIASACVLHNICIIKDDMCDIDEGHVEQPEGIFTNTQNLHDDAAESTNRRDQLFTYMSDQNLL